LAEYAAKAEEISLGVGRGGVGRVAKALGHDNFGASLLRGMDDKFVHEGAHEEDAAAGTLQKILIRERIGDILEAESVALVANIDDELVGGELKGEKNLFLALLPAAVVISVDDAFADGHADFETVIIVEAGRPGDASTHFLSETNTVEKGLERDINALSAVRGWTVKWRRQGKNMGNTAFCGKSMRFGTERGRG
jgi:hypothetical protein